ncbi:hypothetical protein NXF25_014228 [Crotalus adamanteus]|uniref:Uncharacterized protein n=1 Tax=Crotalus adamanteus TaxID=8729 RepID=A0AAW1BBB0_CROAD
MIAVLVMIVLFVKALEQFGLIDSGLEERIFQLSSVAVSLLGLEKALGQEMFSSDLEEGGVVKREANFGSDPC